MSRNRGWEKSLPWWKRALLFLARIFRLATVGEHSDVYDDEDVPKARRVGVAIGHRIYEAVPPPAPPSTPRRRRR